VVTVVDPKAQSVTLCRQGQAPQVFVGADRIRIDDVIPGFELTVAEALAD
jgi:hypothetical protein